jgi:hypothetical protein
MSGQWTADKNVVAVRRKLKARAMAGIKKYGVTTMRDDLSPGDWLQHLQEELMDAAVYIEALMTKVRRLESAEAPEPRLRSGVPLKDRPPL